AGAPVRWARARTGLVIAAERVDGAPRVGLIQATVHGPPPPLASGQRIAAELRLFPATGFHNPDGFDYAAHLARDGIHVTGSTRAERLMALEAPQPPWPARVRAGVLAALLLEREAAVANSLALAALLILALRPGDLLDPGFQLSFAATAGIIAAPLPRGLVGGALGVSLAAQLAVLPITLAHFNQLS